MGIARFTFAPGGADEFKRLSAQCLEIVRAKDPGTLQYDTFLNEAETHAVVIERYRDSASLIAHAANIGDELMAAVIGTAAVCEGELLGDVTDELRARLSDDGPVRLLTLWQSL